MTAFYVVASLLAAALAEHHPGGVALAVKLVPVSLLVAEIGRPFLAGKRTRFRRFLTLGLLFSVVGDLVIAFAFTGGIGAFLLAHASYLAAMGLSRERPFAQAAAFLPAVALSVGMVTLLVPRVEADLKGPVVVYATAIALMLGRATSRAFVTDRSPEATKMFVGASVFALSDSLIAISRWVAPLPHPELAILSTYYLGQWLISRGVPVGRPSVAAAP